MAEHERATKKKQDDSDQKHRVQQPESGSSFDHFLAYERGVSPVTKNPFRPDMAQHASLLVQAHSDKLKANHVLHLQQIYGNKYVQRLLKSMAVQAKLTVNAPNDIYEQEADRVAETVTRALATQVQRQEEEEEEVQAKSFLQRQEEEEEEEEEVQAKSFLQRQEEEEEEEEEVQAKSLLQRQEEEEEEEEVQAKSLLQRQEEEEEVQAKTADYIQRTTANAVPEISSEMEDEINAARGNGEPLNDNIREPMEQAFDTDFSGVRVHTDESADNLNKSLQAEAFTRGQDIFFRSGAYNPESTQGQKLIAHELTHTIQQDANKRIAPWAPTGHRIVTTKALEEEPLKSRYAEEAKAILIERSADMDFIQDQQDKMGTGMAESETNIKKYKEGAKKLKGLRQRLGENVGKPFDVRKKEEEIGETRDKALKKLEKKRGKKAKVIEYDKIVGERDKLKADLDVMWKENQLHIRDENYMRLHGEGGLYRRGRGAAASVNKDVTNLMVNKAVDLYDAGSNTKAIEVLSDALHQAEDRGSHFEGEQGKGHDARQKVKMGDRVPEHTYEFDGVPQIPDEEPLPDNSDKNPEGAKLAIGHAFNVMSSFAAKIKSKEQITAEAPRRRHAKIAGFETTSTGKATKYWEAHFKAGHTGKYLGALEPDEWKKAMEEKKPETGIELLKQKLAERREQMGYEEEVSPQAEEAEEYYIKSMVMQGIRDIVRGKRNKTIRKNRDKYLAQLLSEWPPKHHDKVKEYAEAQLAKYEK